MKKILFFIVLLIGTFQLKAQTPKYYYSLTNKGVNYINVYTALNNSIYKNDYQNLYHPTDLNHPPKGLITHIYLHHATQSIYAQSQGLPLRIRNFRVRMGLTTSDSFGRTKIATNQDECKPKTDEGLLSTVIYDTVYTIPDTPAPNTWLRLPLQSPFFYTPNKNLIVEYSADTNRMLDLNDSLQQATLIYNGPFVYLSTFDKNRTNYDSVNLSVYSITMPNLTIFSYCSGTSRLDFGFDLDTTVNSIDDIPKQPLRVYPNPSSSHISLTYSGSNTAYQISNITGQVVQAGNVKHHEIDISRLPRGMYLLRMGYEVVRFFKEDE